MALNSPSKNCVAQCTFGLVAGLVKVTMVPTGTRMWVGAIAFTAVGFEVDRTGADRGAGLESPQLVPVARVQREQIPVGLTDEEHVARRRKDAVAVGELVGHVLLPLDLVRGRVDGNDAARLVFTRCSQAVAGFRERVRRSNVSKARIHQPGTVA